MHSSTPSSGDFKRGRPPYTKKSTRSASGQKNALPETLMLMMNGKHPTAAVVESVYDVVAEIEIRTFGDFCQTETSKYTCPFLAEMFFKKRSEKGMSTPH